MYSDYIWYETTHRETDDVYIKFYADPACTIPTTLPSDRTIHLEYSEYADFSLYQQFTTTENLTAGSDTYLVEYHLRSSDDRYDYGNLVGADDWDMAVLDGFKR